MMMVTTAGVLAGLDEGSLFHMVQRPVWMGSRPTMAEADWVLVGVPWDGTCSLRPGSRFAPAAIRDASWGLETYSPYTRTSLEDPHVAFYDAGELEVPCGNREKALGMIRTLCGEALAMNKRWFGVGGDHLVTLPTLQAHMDRYPDLAILHFDAHGDLAQDILGEALSHGTIIRRAMDHMAAMAGGPVLDPLVQVGIRSGTVDQFDWMTQGSLHLMFPESEPQEKIQAALNRLSGRPVFLTFDVDVLDPAHMPGTGTPEAGGLSFVQVLRWFEVFSGLNVVGADVVELAPHYDPSGASTFAAAKVIRELLLRFSR